MKSKTEFCVGCGEEMEILDDFGGQKYTKCVNQYCPYKHSGTAKLIANELADARATIQDQKRKITHLKRLLTAYDPTWESW